MSCVSFRIENGLFEAIDEYLLGFSIDLKFTYSHRNLIDIMTLQNMLLVLKLFKYIGLNRPT